MQQLLQQLDGDDPAMALLSRYLAQRTEVQGEAQEDEDEAAEQIRRLTELLEDVSDKLRRVYGEVEELRQQNGILSETRSVLASALGICYQCLGEDSACPVCAGQGYAGSGYFEPDNQNFWHYVAPAVRIKQSISQSNHRPL